MDIPARCGHRRLDMNIGRTQRDLEIRRVGAVRANIDIWTRGSRHLVKEGLRLDRHWIWTLLGSGHYVRLARMDTRASVYSHESL